MGHRLVGALVAAVLVVGACGRGTPAEEPAAVTPLLKAAGWRAGMDPFTSPLAVLEIAYDRASAEAAWEDNVADDLPPRTGEPAEPGIYGSLDDVDLDAQVVAVWSSGESGTCPEWLAEVRVDDRGRVELTVEDTAEPGEPCTTDYNPYRMVVAIARDRVPPIEELPIDEVTGVGDGLVVPYPLLAGG